MEATRRGRGARVLITGSVPAALAGIALAAVALGGSMLVAPSSALAQDQPQYETTEIADGVYRFRWEGHNTLFVVTPEGVLAFDPISPEAAFAYAAEIERVAPGKPLHGIIYSHDHADHISGAPTLFAELREVPVIAHENAYAKIAAANDPDRPPPDITFTEKSVLRLGGQVIELHYLGPSHSDNMLVAFLPEQRVAFAVDFVAHNAVGYRSLNNWYYPEFYDAMRRLQEIPYETIVFGHGVMGDRASVDALIRYYEDLRDAVQEAIDAGMTKEEAMESVRMPERADWRGYENWFPMNVGTMWEWLSGEDG